MSKFTVGEEVRYDGEVYVIAAREEGPPRRFRLLASRPGGTRFVWALEDELRELDSYLRSEPDTHRY